MYKVGFGLGVFASVVLSHLLCSVNVGLHNLKMTHVFFAFITDVISLCICLKGYFTPKCQFRHQYVVCDVPKLFFVNVMLLVTFFITSFVFK